MSMGLLPITEKPARDLDDWSTLSRLHDVLDVTLEDPELLEEVELLAEIMAATRLRAKPLTRKQLDLLLGVDRAAG